MEQTQLVMKQIHKASYKDLVLEQLVMEPS